jgi:DNA-binding SARP family transcriptional activator
LRIETVISSLIALTFSACCPERDCRRAITIRVVDADEPAVRTYRQLRQTIDARKFLGRPEHRARHRPKLAFTSSGQTNSLGEVSFRVASWSCPKRATRRKFVFVNVEADMNSRLSQVIVERSKRQGRQTDVRRAA